MKPPCPYCNEADKKRVHRSVFNQSTLKWGEGFLAVEGSGLQQAGKISFNMKCLGLNKFWPEL